VVENLKISINMVKCDFNASSDCYKISFYELPNCVNLINSVCIKGCPNCCLMLNNNFNGYDSILITPVVGEYVLFLYSDNCTGMSTGGEYLYENCWTNNQRSTKLNCNDKSDCTSFTSNYINNNSILKINSVLFYFIIKFYYSIYH